MCDDLFRHQLLKQLRSRVALGIVLLAPAASPEKFDPEFLSAADLLGAAVLLREAEALLRQPPPPAPATRP